MLPKPEDTAALHQLIADNHQAFNELVCNFFSHLWFSIKIIFLFSIAGHSINSDWYKIKKPQLLDVVRGMDRHILHVKLVHGINGPSPLAALTGFDYVKAQVSDYLHSAC